MIKNHKGAMWLRGVFIKLKKVTGIKKSNGEKSENEAFID